MTARLKSRKAFTLIEMGIVLMLAGLVIGAIWLAAATVNHNRKKSQLSENTLLIVQNLRAVYSTQRDTTGLSNALAITMGVFPDKMLKNTGSGTDVVDSFGNPFSVAASAVTPRAGFSLSFTNVPGDACIELLSGRLVHSAGAIKHIGLYSVGSGSSEGNTQIANPISPADAFNNFCQAGNNDFVLSFLVI